MKTILPIILLLVLYGKASFYSNDYCRKFNPACITASGEKFDDTKMTTACPSFIKLGTWLRVSHKDKSILVKCNDYGNFYKKYGRKLDLAKEAFRNLAPLSKGIIEVKIETL